MAQSRPHPDALRPVARPRLYEQLVGQLVAYIEQAGLQPGDRLPTERDLAARLGVSRASVAQAIVALEVQGVVSVRQGDGIYLLQRADARKSLQELVKRRQRLPDILEAREAIEVKITALAAERRTDSDLAAIEDALEVMEQEVASGQHGFDGDMAFHAAVTAAAHNEVLAGLMELLAPSIAETRRESLSQPGRPRRSLAGHRSIAEAIRSGDPAAATRAARRHIQLVANVALLTWGEEGHEGHEG